MAINVGNLVIANTVVDTNSTTVKIETTVTQMEEGTVVHNGRPKKFNKNMSAYMIDMLTSED